MSFRRQITFALQKNLVKGFEKFSQHSACAGIRAGHNGASSGDVDKMAINHFGGTSSKGAVIPARPWLDYAIGGAKGEFEEALAQKIRSILGGSEKSTTSTKEDMLENPDIQYGSTKGGKVFVQENGRGGWENALREIAKEMAREEKEAIEAGSYFEPNAPSTLARKQRGHLQLLPLRATDTSMNAIHGWVE